MSEFKELYGNEFFIIDSNNVESIKSRLYGFSILRNGIIENDDLTEDMELLGFGSYIHIKENYDEITIHQDLNGSWGLYIFKHNNYFAISNSFLKLVEYLKDNYELKFNEDFGKALMSTGIVTLIFRQTLIKEIDTIPRNYIVHIDKNSGTVKYTKTDYKMHVIPLNSIEALDILDNWFYRWINLLRSLKEKTNNIEFNLSGGFDTRINMVLLLNANVDLDKVRIKTYDNYRTKVHKEDYEIASEIAKEFGFKLNNNIISAKRKYFTNIDTIINSAFYIKGGFHNQLDYRFFRTEEPVYNFSGAAAEMMRTDSLYYDKSFDEIFNHYLALTANIDSSFVSPVKKIINESLSELALEFNIENKKSKDLFDLIFTETRCRNHFGKFSVAEYFTNKILFTPLVDPDLHKLKIVTDECDDKYLLYTLIFVRYCPKLLDFKVEGNRVFNKDTIEYAKKISELKKFTLKDFDYISGPDLSNNSVDFNSGFMWEDIDNYLMEVYNQKSFEFEFKKVFPNRLYSKLRQFVLNSVYFPLGSIYPVFHILKVLDSINYRGDNDFGHWAKSFFMENKFYNLSQNELISSPNSLSNVEDFSFSKSQMKFLQNALSENKIYKDIIYDVVESYVDIRGIVKLTNIKIIDFKNNDININPSKLKIILDNDDNKIIDFKFDESELGLNVEFPVSHLGFGIHNLCLKYEMSYSEDFKIFVKEEDNLLDWNLWSGSDFNGNIKGFDKFQVKSIESTEDWAEVGNKSIKVVCDGKKNYQALTLEGCDVSIGDLINASVTVYNPNGDVIVRLYEYSSKSFNNVTVVKSDAPTRVTISKIAKSNRMQLLIYARDQQIFYADNFVFKRISSENI